MPVCRTRPHRTRPPARRRSERLDLGERLEARAGGEPAWKEMGLGRLPLHEMADALTDLVRWHLALGARPGPLIFMFKPGADEAVELREDLHQVGWDATMSMMRLGFSRWRPEKYAFVAVCHMAVWDHYPASPGTEPDEKPMALIIGAEASDGQRLLRVHELRPGPPPENDDADPPLRVGEVREDLVEELRHDAPWFGLLSEHRVH